MAERPTVSGMGTGRLNTRKRSALAAEVRAIIVMRAGTGASLRALAREFDVSHETVRRIAQSNVQLERAM
jgi:DNA invertase Pin-like site-specific DNA recombinase